MHPGLAFVLVMVIAIPLLWIATSLEKIAHELKDLRFAADLIERQGAALLARSKEGIGIRP